MQLQIETIYGQIVAKANNYLAVPDGHGGRRIIKDKAIRDYERAFIQQCRIYKGRGIDTDFTLHVKVYESSMAYDLDNSLKTLLDCLQYVGAIKDDNLCTRIVAEKHIDRRRPRVEYAIQTAQTSLFEN